MLSSKGFWFGAVAGVAALYLWHMYQAKKAR